MKSLINLNRITKVSYMFGIACLLVGIMFSFVTQTGEAATANNSSCGTGYTSKDESAPFEYNGSKIIDKVIIKAGTGCFKLTKSDPSNGCYKANGLGTSSVKVKMIGEEGPECQAISHVLFFGDDKPPETTEPPPATTEPPPATTESPPTEVTPTDPTPTDPTPTDPTPTDPTPTDPTPTDPTPTEPTEVVTPTETETPTDSPETVTPTDPPAETPTPTDPPETPKETDPPKEKKDPTPPPTLAQPTPMEGTPQVLIPQTGVDLSSSNQIFGSQFFLLLGLTFIGIGMIFQGFSKRRTRNES